MLLHLLNPSKNIYQSVSMKRCTLTRIIRSLRSSLSTLILRTFSMIISLWFTSKTTIKTTNTISPTRMIFRLACSATGKRKLTSRLVIVSSKIARSNTAWSFFRKTLLCCTTPRLKLWPKLAQKNWIHKSSLIIVKTSPRIFRRSLTSLKISLNLKSNYRLLILNSLFSISLTRVLLSVLTS